MPTEEEGGGESPGAGGSRRQFLAMAGAGLVAAGAVTAGGAWWLRRARDGGGGLSGGLKEYPPMPGELVGHAAERGHRLRDALRSGGLIGPSGSPIAPARVVDLGVVIVGGGIAGLTAARELGRAGISDLRVLELEDETGGNASWGRNAVSAYPWGAHYLPIPSRESEEVRELLRELGVIERGQGLASSDYREEMLCGDPGERLWIYGMWQEGLVPKVGLRKADREQMDAFFGEMERLRMARGKDDRRAFAIPLERSSQDPEFMRLDGVTFAHYLGERGWNSKPLRWYLDYCCRDDYGADASRVSAWAGIHYFAARPRGGALLTWPQGNGWIAERLAAPVRDRVVARTLAYSVREESGRVLVDAWDAGTGQTVRYRARAAILAVPRFAAARLLAGSGPGHGYGDGAALPQYAPWLVTNITLSLHSARQRDVLDHDLAWDTVSYHSRSLGYVHARHQELVRDVRESVLTHYWPLDEQSPVEARKWAVERTQAQWAEQVCGDLERLHPGIRSVISRVDARVWGHAMPVPAPGWLTRCRTEGAQGGGRSASGRIELAHSDRSGLSLFEQAHFQGLRAAKAIRGKLAHG